MSSVNNIYQPEQAIIQRLKDKMPGWGAVASGSALAGDISQLIQPAAAFVVARKPRHAYRDTQGLAVDLIVAFELIVCVPHLLGIDSPETTASAAGVWLYGIIRYLSGWHPAPGFTFLTLAEHQPEPEYSLVGRAEFPLVFECALVIACEGNDEPDAPPLAEAIADEVWT